MGCVAIGAVFSLAVFLQPMSEATGWSRTGVSSAMTIVFLTMGFASFGWGALTDRFGPRLVVLAGAVLLGLGPGAGEPRHQPARIPAHLRRHRRRRRRRDLRADDGHGDRLVREAPQPRRVAGFGRHGHGADDDLALRELADHDLRLAHRPARRSPSSPGCSWCRRRCWCAARRRSTAPAMARGRAGRRRSRHDRRAGAALAAVHRAGGHLLLLLRHAFRARSSIP